MATIGIYYINIMKVKHIHCIHWIKLPDQILLLNNMIGDVSAV